MPGPIPPWVPIAPDGSQYAALFFDFINGNYWSAGVVSFKDMIEVDQIAHPSPPGPDIDHSYILHPGLGLEVLQNVAIMLTPQPVSVVNAALAATKGLTVIAKFNTLGSNSDMIPLNLLPFQPSTTPFLEFLPDIQTALGPGTDQAGTIQINSASDVFIFTSDYPQASPFQVAWTYQGNNTTAVSANGDAPAVASVAGLSAITTTNYIPFGAYYNPLPASGGTSGGLHRYMEWVCVFGFGLDPATMSNPVTFNPEPPPARVPGPLPLFINGAGIPLPCIPCCQTVAPCVCDAAGNAI